MKPTQEQVEAARFFLYDWQLSGETVDDLAIRIAARDAERDRKWEEASLRLDADPHQWSKRPCSTCESITKAVGRDFGCVAYAKSPLTYMGYGRAAIAKLGAEEKR